LKSKINLLKGLKEKKTIKKMGIKLKKKPSHYKLRLNDEIKNKSKFHKRAKE
jgi:hypothetical protein